MLNWNRTYIKTASLSQIELFEIELFFDIETLFTLNWMINKELFWHLTVCNKICTYT